MVAPSLFLLFVLSIINSSLASVNIDCGTSTSDIDKNKIKWVGDKDFITSGVSKTVSSTTIDKDLTTLRYFPTGDSNCYTNIPVTKGGKVLVRTNFYYGNYDGKSSSPSFSVVFEGKHLGTVEISSAFDSYLLELIFPPAGEETSVCFVRTSSSNPFVSSIEVYDLDEGMYDELGPDEGLFYHKRIAYANTEYLRSDPQGRFWSISETNDLVTGTPSSADSIDTSGASNKPPESVLVNSWSLEDLTIVDPSLPLEGIPVYLAMYFSEPSETGTRSFNVFFGGKQVNKGGPVVPVYGKATQLVVRDVVASSSTELELMSTSVEYDPPLINAAELYRISTASTNGSPSGSRGSGGSTNGKNSKLPIILGVVFIVAFLLIAYVVIAVVLTKRRKARLQALALPKSTVPHMGTGESPLFGEAMGNDSSQPTTEGDMGDQSSYVEK